jgi:acetyl esterase/lipase
MGAYQQSRYGGRRFARKVFLVLVTPVLAGAMGPCKTASELRDSFYRGIALHRQAEFRGRRKALRTTIKGNADRSVAPQPPADLFEKVKYPAPLGENVAYVSPVRIGAKRPAIVWIDGGFDWGIDDSAWQPAPRSNDQSARGFREAGVVVMLPALRGSNENPGNNECFLGEVDDILAAADFVGARADVDPDRVYLGGHSTGGTLVLLAAASTDRFRAVFSFAPVGDARQYGEAGCLPETISDEEILLRAPIAFMNQITTTTFVISGIADGADIFPYLKENVGRAPVGFFLLAGGDHFNILAPGIESIAQAILHDTGDAATNIRLTEEELRNGKK